MLRNINRLLNRQMLKILLALILLSFTNIVSAKVDPKEAKTKPEYRCETHESGGFIHEKDGHHLARFKTSEDYRIVPFSKVPDEAVPMLVIFQGNNLGIDFGIPFVGITDRKVSDVRKAYMGTMDKISHVDDLTEIYVGLSFLRNTSSDPTEATSYTSCVQDDVFRSRRRAHQTDIKKITCNKGDHSLFQFVNGRFSSAYLGSWQHEKESSDYYGDTSWFNFGTCKRYYD
jgi:hypothetical protein